MVLQWIPSQCGIKGNVQADRTVKFGVEDKQDENNITPIERKIFIKVLHKPPQPADSYHCLSTSDQVITFHLRAGHNRLKVHLNQQLHLMSPSMCSLEM